MTFANAADRHMEGTGDPDAAQRLSDSVDQVAAEEPTTSSPETLRSDVDAALAATGQDRLDRDSS